MIGYHFVGETLRNGAPIPPNRKWLEHSGLVAPCKSGLHLSKHPFDAVRYAPGSTLCLVELKGDLQSHGDPVDKWVGRRRRILKRIDAEHLLRRFAADQALSVKHLWDMPDIVLEYLTTLDKSKRDAAGAAAWNAARAAVGDATWNASRAAVGAAAWNAARAARAASWAAEDIVRAASWAAEDIVREDFRSRREDFRSRVEKEFNTSEK